MNNTIVFLGDSLTQWGHWNERLPGKEIHNYGIAGNTTAQILQRLKPVLALAPDKLFFMAGVNDLGNGESVPQIMLHYKQIISTIAQGKKKPQIFVYSVLPVNKELFCNAKLHDDSIPYLNSEIKEFALENGYTFINLYPLFALENGKLSKTFTEDGLHLNEVGYELWKQQINKLI